MVYIGHLEHYGYAQSINPRPDDACHHADCWALCCLILISSACISENVLVVLQLIGPLSHQKLLALRNKTPQITEYLTAQQYYR